MAGKYLASGIEDVFVVLEKRILGRRPGVLPSRHDTSSQSRIVLERDIAALLLSPSVQHT